MTNDSELIMFEFEFLDFLTYYTFRDTKFGTHVTKCRRTYLEARISNPRLPNIIPCAYNWHHHIPQVIYEQHISMCPDALKHSADLILAKEQRGKLSII
jgi:hypothetical protein